MARKATNPQNLIPGANKNGRPKITEQEREAREFYRKNEIEIAKLQELTIEQLFELAKDKTQPFWKVDAVKKLLAQYKADRYDFIEARKNRALGAPKQQIDIEGEIETKISIKDSAKQLLEMLADESNKLK